MRKRWLITLLFLVPTLLTIVAIHRRHTVPLDECSEVYRRYHKAEGIQAAFIRDMPINDSISLDVTLFAADDSLAFVGLMKKWNISDSSIYDYRQGIVDEQSRFVGQCPKGHPELPPDKNDLDNNELLAIFPALKSAIILHTHNEKELDQIFEDIILKKFKL
jgi:hypothetical protein